LLLNHNASEEVIESLLKKFALSESEQKEGEDEPLGEEEDIEEDEEEKGVKPLEPLQPLQPLQLQKEKGSNSQCHELLQDLQNFS
jgi:hypothetical protein